MEDPAPRSSDLPPEEAETRDHPAAAAPPEPPANLITPGDGAQQRIGFAERGRGLTHEQRAAVAYAAVLAALIVLRAAVHALDFLSVGWLLVIAAVPLLPWLAPALSALIQRHWPSVRSVKIGVLQLERRDVPSVAALGVVADFLASESVSPTGFTSTDAAMIVQGLRTIGEHGAAVVNVDLRGGLKWRLPNLYLLARLLEADPAVHAMVFTEERGGTDGYFVAIGEPQPIRSRIEEVVPAYRAAGSQLALRLDGHSVDTDDLANRFNQFRQAIALPNAVGAAASGEVALTSAWVREALAPAVVEARIDADQSLLEAQVRALVAAPARYVARVDRDGRFRGVIDRDAVALAVARKLLSPPVVG